MAPWPPGPSRRSGRRLVRAGAVLAVTLVLGWPGAASGQAAGDHPKWMYDAAQTGANPAETLLGTGNVSRLWRAWSRDLLVGGGSPVVAGGRVYLGVTGGNGNGWGYALDAATGATRWTVDTGTPYPPKHLALAGGRLVVPTIGDPDGLLLALDPATGRVVWRSTAGTFGPPAVVGNRVYAADEGGALFAKDVTNGINRWIGNGRSGPGPARPRWAAAGCSPSTTTAM